MNSKSMAILGALLCGGATIALMFGDGGWNPRTKTLAALIVAGFVVSIVFYIRSSREQYQTIAEKSGLRHVPDMTFDIAFKAVNTEFPIRFEFVPPQSREAIRTLCKITIQLHLPEQLRISVTPKLKAKFEFPAVISAGQGIPVCGLSLFCGSPFKGDGKGKGAAGADVDQGNDEVKGQ